MMLKIQLRITGIHYILKYIQIEIGSFKIFKIIQNCTVFTEFVVKYFWPTPDLHIYKYAFFSFNLSYSAKTQD